ncbi:hypothetical protein BDA99DRAFT_498636 [Phascolomyces articulosus]|uniref:COP9 signalosome complex subunit 3 N-terminal helical repeats domain-containing protein n=1 Tax=Phascolomyces articulosus TaxID=60185 RepID=A0AAD5PIS3_9FUNG|nr:hypothetical protein BDA99DRAFT_498636 [Phascolomyces articulosus]
MADRQQQPQRRNTGDAVSPENSNARPTTRQQQTVAADPQLIDEILAFVTSVEEHNAEQMKTMAKKLVRLPEPHFQANTTTNLDPLTVLDPAQHSLGYLFFLTSRCSAVSDAEVAQFLVQAINHFVNVFKPEQLLYAPTRITHIAHALDHLAKLLQNPLIPIVPLTIAINRLTPEKNTLTPLHAPLAKASLLAKMYRQPLEILDHDIENVDPAGFDISIKSFLLYHYYSAMIYIGNKNFERAIEFLVLTISAPAQVISAIQVEAYKKYILVSLIHLGRVPPLPRYTSVVLEKYFKNKHPEYSELVDSFQKGLPQLRASIEAHREPLTEDSHIGLAKQCIEALRREIIKRLGDVYVTLTMGEMAQLVSEKEKQTVNEDDLERMLLAMIEHDQLFASISCILNESGQSIKMVHFADEETTGISLNFEQRIMEATQLRKKVSIMDKSEGLSKDFQTKYMMISSHGEHFPVAMAYDEDMDLPLDEDSKLF